MAPWPSLPQFPITVFLLMRLSLYYGTLNIATVHTAASNDQSPPHIVLILADDLGYDDVSIHGNDEIPTPNIDALGYQGQILNRHYVAPMCTPSRAVLLTGKYMLRTGMQHHVISNPEPWGLPAKERVLPEYLRELGYSTNLVGKWHLGFAYRAMTPTCRGFDHFRGYLGGYVDYYGHNANVSGMNGGDWRRNEEADWEGSRGEYATDTITRYAVDVIERHAAASKPLFLMINHLAPHTGNRDRPMQAPEEYVQRFAYIKDEKRRMYAAMVSKLDESVGDIVQSLRDRDLLKNSVILFSSDNGAPSLGEHSNRGSNYPLRGQKDSPWEGAIRSAAVFWAAQLQTRHINNDQLIYLGDWLPTFLNLANGGEAAPQDIDGVNQWGVLNRPGMVPSPRQEIVHNIDTVTGYVSYLRADGFKYVNGTTLENEYGGWYGLQREFKMDAKEYVGRVKASKAWMALSGFAQRNLTDEEVLGLRGGEICGKEEEMGGIACDPQTAPCLFNVFVDPCERHNLADVEVDTLKELQSKVEEWRLKAVPVNNRPIEKLANPNRHNGMWSSWRD